MHGDYVAKPTCTVGCGVTCRPSHTVCGAQYSIQVLFPPLCKNGCSVVGPWGMCSNGLIISGRGLPHHLTEASVPECQCLVSSRRQKVLRY